MSIVNIATDTGSRVRQSMLSYATHVQLYRVTRIVTLVCLSIALLLFKFSPEQLFAVRKALLAIGIVAAAWSAHVALNDASYYGTKSWKRITYAAFLESRLRDMGCALNDTRDIATHTSRAMPTPDVMALMQTRIRIRDGAVTEVALGPIAQVNDDTAEHEPDPEYHYHI